MPTDLVELVEFLHHGNTQIRQIATETLVGYSSSKPEIFKKPQLVPVKDLKLLTRDYAPIAKNATTILINLSANDEEVIKYLAEDIVFITSLITLITNGLQPYIKEVCMLLANLTKSPALESLVSLKLPKTSKEPSSTAAIDQLIDRFVQVSDQPNTAYDYLSFVFADLSRHSPCRKYFTTTQKYDQAVPITKLLVFLDHKNSSVRRKGAASAVKNICFEVEAHPYLVSESGANLLPYLLLPLAGNEELSDEDMDGMLPDLQLLDPDKTREGDKGLMVTYLDTLLLLTTTREGRDLMRRVKVYPIIRECHLHVEDDNVREACDRLAQVLLRDEDDQGDDGGREDDRPGQDDDNKVVAIF